MELTLRTSLSIYSLSQCHCALDLLKASRKIRILYA